MSDILELTKIIKELCADYSLLLETPSEGNFKIFTDHASGITLFLKIQGPTDFSFYFLQRTYDIVYHGDRSDVHVIISLMFSSFLRSMDSGISSSQFDIAHPIVDDEIWGRYIMPIQGSVLLGISSWEKIKEAVFKIIPLLAVWREVFWKFAGCPCEECLKKDNINNYREYEVPNEILATINMVFKKHSNFNSGNRQRPNWSYYYDINNEVTIIKSEMLCFYLESILKFTNRKYETIEGINGVLILDGELTNFIKKKHVKEIEKVLANLMKSKMKHKFSVIPLENMVIAVKNPYIIALGRLCGIEEYKIEREHLRNRHNKESQLLFPVSLFEWNEIVCPDEFEALVKSLLEREPNVKFVRKPAPINQGDKGRDLLIEWYILDSQSISKTTPPSSLVRIVGQCKASNKTIGKNKVLDIRDTVETHNASGYFLAVSAQISGPLTEKLEDLKSKGIWTHWWNRDDIEKRLSKNQDLIPYFPKVLKAKNKVKFVDKG
ncbi:hypothetical protein [Larkinella sp.]|uniref:hypothetical protein n=1 Tax=Larkinella sp. TaxID=2034517 RepID=UPI003BAC297B